MAVLVSRELLLDWNIMEIILNCYNPLESNDKIIPLIVQNDLYNPKEKSEILNLRKSYIEEYESDYFDKDYNGIESDELRKMQRILDAEKAFLSFSLVRDKKSNMTLAQRIIKYIKHDMGIDLNENFTERGEASKVSSITEYNNNFYGPVNGLQMQQGNERAAQFQNIGQDDIDYEAIRKVIEEINKSESRWDEVYGDEADKVREIISEATALAEKKKNPERIKGILLELKNLSVGVAGSLIASGIVNLISYLKI